MPIAQPMPTPVSHTDIANRTRKFFVLPSIGRNVTDGTDVIVTFANAGAVLVLPDAKVSYALSRLVVPADYVSGMQITGVVTAGGGGNIYARQFWYAAACSEVWDTHSDSNALAAEAINADVKMYNCLRVITPAGIASGDIVILLFERDATDALDTANQALEFVGWLVEYTADM